jgi:hypothetical protein
MKLAETPIKVNKLLDLIEHYPNKIDKQILSAGFLHGFKVGYESPRDPTNCNNLISAHQNKNALAKKNISTNVANFSNSIGAAEQPMGNALSK